MEKCKTFEDLIVWKKAHLFVLAIYKCTASFPKSEQFGLISQFRRASVSIAANIAEGFKKRTLPEKIRFYNIAQGSIEECRYYLILSNDLGYFNEKDCWTMLDEVSKLLESYIGKLRQN